MKASNQEDKPTFRGFWKKFNIMDAMDNIAESWGEVKPSYLNSSWRYV